MSAPEPGLGRSTPRADAIRAARPAGAVGAHGRQKPHAGPYGDPILGARLRAARVAVDLRLVEVAVELGVAVATVTAWEQADRRVKPKYLTALCTLYGEDFTRPARLYVLVIVDADDAVYVHGVYPDVASAKAGAQHDLDHIHTECVLPRLEPLAWTDYPDGSAGASGHAGDRYGIHPTPSHLTPEAR